MLLASFKADALNPWSKMDDKEFILRTLHKLSKEREMSPSEWQAYCDKIALQEKLFVSMCSVCKNVLKTAPAVSGEAGGISHTYCVDCASVLYEDMGMEVPKKFQEQLKTEMLKDKTFDDLYDLLKKTGVYLPIKIRELKERIERDNLFPSYS